MEVPHLIWLQLAQWFHRRHLKTHTHILCTPEHNSWDLFQMKNMGGGGEGGALKAKHYNIYIFFFFCGGGAFFNPVGSWLLWKLYHFLQVMVLLKNAVCSNGICWNEKKTVPIFGKWLSRKKWVMRVPWWWCWLISWPYRWWFSREVKSRRIHSTISR